jgi:hypothetical protein
VEAPFELNYANSGEIQGFAEQSGLQGWEGVDALCPAERFGSKGYPWIESVLTFGYQALLRLGWSPEHITLVQPPAKESVPLICRVWRKCPPEAKRNPSSSWQVLRSLYENAPDILRFPEAISRYPAIGSLYWNSHHPKMARIITALTLLAESVRQKQLSAEEMELVSYLDDSAFQGYVVRSRYSGLNLALEVPNRLLAIARKHCLVDVEDLNATDFFPGTIDGYQNPYHYDLRPWEILKTGLGKHL